MDGDTEALKIVEEIVLFIYAGWQRKVTYK